MLVMVVVMMIVMVMGAVIQIGASVRVWVWCCKLALLESERDKAL